MIANENIKALGGVLVAVLIAAGLALAGSVTVARGVPLFALCVGIAFLIQWIVYVPSYIGRTEKFYDLTGSLTYTTVILVAVISVSRFDARSILLTVLVLIWTSRLGFFLFRRIKREGEDTRFREIKQSATRFLLTWTLQGLWVSFTAAAALGAITAEVGVPFGVWGIAGLCLWIAGFSFEAIADFQKSRFTADPANRDRFITTGLWSLSRHPNYFGEIVLWVGIALIALPALKGWAYITLISPVFVALLITQISGVPMLEKFADNTWGGQEDYEEYKRTTPVLVPKLPFM